MTCREFSILEYMSHGKTEKEARAILDESNDLIPMAKLLLDMEATDWDKEKLKEGIDLEFSDPNKLNAEIQKEMEEFQNNLRKQ